MENVIEVRNLCKNYPSFQLKNVSFTVPSGSIVGFIGENGAGKTTTIKLILNEIRRDAGSVKIFGMDNIQDECKIKEQIGVVFDESYFHSEFKASDIAKILKRIYKSWDDALYDDYLRRFRISKDKIIKEYSKGMKMKLSIASALAHHPRLLILDEATSGLDPIVRSEILDIFLDFIQDESHAILFSSHITGDLEKVADYITFIHEGNVVFDRSKDDLIYLCGIVKCGAADFQKLDKTELVRWHKNECGYEALVENRDEFKRKHPRLVVDAAAIDEIMLLYVKGEKA
ncbi:ABC transporter ATP-binding protein [Caproiciproducens galactitolivorans]|uniref:ABC transporter ATP-binding protein YtrB n=1 Tax=Caproiciproducens galactitolivorans TaxID=642589 RepID=A0A4Z0YJX3_9FIRM|nr:ABC transporter ATP-binding protein [Caproiciproducens galactitolivorans]QEY35468.1 ABC transporter ATP-binding protein [Caproiciproducens galactitolivorans]TGJ77182.1 ABC transporter ATP-binding protein YtrB [Caproiciproducens galactitolivorans]